MAKSETFKQLRAEIGRDLSTFVNDYIQQLKNTTPVKSGKAQKGWTKTFTGKLNTSGVTNIARNDVPYITKLDAGSSIQAPRGIVEPALNKTRRK